MRKYEYDVEDVLRAEARRVQDVRIVKLPANLFPGIPDDLLIGSSGRVCFLEAKRERTGVVAFRQRQWHDWLREHGHTVRIPETEEEARYLVRFYGS